jgi:hypothetical protein
MPGAVYICLSLVTIVSGSPGKVVGQQVTRVGFHPLVEVDLFEPAVVPSLHDLKIVIADVLDRVSSPAECNQRLPA